MKASPLDSLPPPLPPAPPPPPPVTVCFAAAKGDAKSSRPFLSMSYQPLHLGCRLLPSPAPRPLAVSGHAVSHRLPPSGGAVGAPGREAPSPEAYIHCGPSNSLACLSFSPGPQVLHCTGPLAELSPYCPANVTSPLPCSGQPLPRGSKRGPACVHVGASVSADCAVSVHGSPSSRHRVCLSDFPLRWRRCPTPVPMSSVPKDEGLRPCVWLMRAFHVHVVSEPWKGPVGVTSSLFYK